MDTRNEEYAEYKKLRQNVKQLQDELQKRISAEAELESEVKRLHEETIPLSAARALTHVALCKGRALEILSGMTSSNSVNTSNLRWAFRSLYKFAFGDIAYAKKIGEDRSAQYHYNETQLRLFRQEQLLLLAENERLSSQIKNLQLELAQNYKATKLEKIVSSKPSKRRGQTQPRSGSNNESIRENEADSISNSELETESDSESETSSCIALNVELVTRHLWSLIHCMYSAFQRRKLLAFVTWKLTTNRSSHQMSDGVPNTSSFVNDQGMHETSGSMSTSRFFEFLQRRYRIMLLAKGFWRIWSSCYSPLFKRKINCGVVRGPGLSSFRPINHGGLMYNDSAYKAIGGLEDVAYVTVQGSGASISGCSTAFATQPHYLANLPSFSKITYAPRNTYFETKDLPPFPKPREGIKSQQNSLDQNKSIPPYFRPFDKPNNYINQRNYSSNSIDNGFNANSAGRSDINTARTELISLLEPGAKNSSFGSFHEGNINQFQSGPMDNISTKLKYLDILTEAIDE
ncbi:uncharacterized protein cubi_03024 [Cryptosporidium ubiquitum]|uniref:Uncharacterized protein n=1 Tax=Cryptosporidium ubiquitum TaxID=857276 RepID=A0A1J4MPU2_9CRYT|nr:uncharacterized protein cubi_03024 [Cryptosporidium ubiquitum]OII74893.1 hypothetical protein cubi_03024 [Cryptosporidium ubiquitum]